MFLLIGQRVGNKIILHINGPFWNRLNTGLLLMIKIVLVLLSVNLLKSTSNGKFILYRSRWSSCKNVINGPDL
ncbi:Uncharacterised protein [Lysinibacillus sphaericus]|nr:Uncharacterised protein [Lysinibacillus sphaericus]